MKLAVVLAVLLSGSLSLAKEETTEEFIVRQCLTEKLAVACVDAGFQLETENSLALSKRFYDKACEYGSIESCGYKPKYMVKKPKK